MGLLRLDITHVDAGSTFDPITTVRPARRQSMNHLGPINQSSLHQRATIPKIVVIARPCYFPEVRPLGLISRGSPLAFKHRQPFDSAGHTTSALKMKLYGLRPVVSLISSAESAEALTLLRSSSYGGSVRCIHPRAHARGLLRRRIKVEEQLLWP